MPGIDQYTKLLLHMDGDRSSTIGGNDSYTKLLLHMDTTPFVDDSHEIFPVTNNNVTINTSIKKFGGGSGYFNGSSAYLSVPDSDNFDFGSSDFTIDLWVRISNISSNNPLVSQTDNASSNISFRLFYASNNVLRFGYSTDGTNLVENNRTWIPTANIWHHVAVTRNGTVGKIFVDGTQIGANIDFTGITLYNSSSDLKIGNDWPGNNYFGGFMDEIRLSNGIARWTSNFTPPTEPYSPNYISGNMNYDGRIIVLRESDWSVVHNEMHTGGSYIASGLGSDNVTALFRRSNGKSMCYGNISPQ
ncbi:MAG: hypothetical protein DRO67_05645 [Candidatus Asgardarchaeum californiense]|nr:MAG: hypothetical protein DRO67_05645 [Candidatus Asgardarchaeum californiense]